jgi:hypothetical protein
MITNCKLGAVFKELVLAALSESSMYTKPDQISVALRIGTGRMLLVVCERTAGSYEWALVHPDGSYVFEKSDVGFGDEFVALRDGLCAYFGNPEPSIEVAQ